MSVSKPQAISAETEARSAPQDQGKHAIVDPASGHAREALMPSEIVPPTRSTTEPQQASTQPDDGSHVEADHNDTQADASQPDGKVPWKDQVLGYAKVTRGKVLGKNETQDVGHKILQGEIAPKETNKASH